MRVIEVDNGRRWNLEFYRGNKLVDIIDLENCRGSKLPQYILQLYVIREDFPTNQFTVEDRIREALNLLIY